MKVKALQEKTYWTSDKARLHERLRDLSKAWGEKASLKNAILDSFIISATPYDDLRKYYGDEVVQQELYQPAVDAAREYFKAQFKRAPTAEDHLFWTVPAFACHKPEPMGYHVLLFRMKKFGEQLQALGIITRKIDWTVHITRRTYATILYRSGMKVKALQEKTRHKSRDILLDHYISDSESARPCFAKIFEGVV